MHFQLNLAKKATILIILSFSKISEKEPPKPPKYYIIYIVVIWICPVKRIIVYNLLSIA